MLQGAEVLLYPTAIGSEPPNPTYNSYPHWARVMQGHAGANMVRRGLPCLFLRMWCLSFALPVWGGSVPVMHSPQAEGCRLGLLECACCASIRISAAAPPSGGPRHRCRWWRATG